MKWVSVFLAMMVLAAVGCSSIPAKNVANLSLGMTPAEVTAVMGEPYTIRAAKIYDDGSSTIVWEYTPRFFEINPKSFWVQFVDNKVVQWGEPGDFAGKSGKSVPVGDYVPSSSSR